MGWRGIIFHWFCFECRALPVIRRPGTIVKSRTQGTKTVRIHGISESRRRERQRTLAGWRSWILRSFPKSPYKHQLQCNLCFHSNYMLITFLHPGSGVDWAGVGGRERDHDFGSRNAFVENADGTMSRLASARTHAKKAQWLLEYSRRWSNFAGRVLGVMVFIRTCVCVFLFVFFLCVCVFCVCF